MKKTFLYITFIVLSSMSAFAQSDSTISNPTTPSCYDSLITLFRTKGVTEVKDGIHKTIITVRKDGKCTAFEGKVTVVKYKMTLPILVKDSAGKWVPVKSTGRTLDELYDKTTLPVEFSIINGMSPTYLTNLGELGDIFFVNLLKK